MLHLFLALLIVSASTGCTLLHVPPPAPPLALPLSGGPDEYVASPPKWKPGARTSTRYQSWVEVRAGDRVVLNRVEQGVLTAKGIDRTARGLTRVELSVNGQAIGFVFFSDEGKIEDVVVTNPKVPKDAKESFEDWVNPIFWELRSLRLKRGERTPVDIPSSAFLKGSPPEWLGSFRDPVVLGIEYIGLVEFQG